MADYLTNLASKTLSIGETVRPRRVSIFEPVWSEETIIDAPNSISVRTDSVADSPISPRDAQPSAADREKPAPHPALASPPGSHELRRRPSTTSTLGRLDLMPAEERASNSDQAARGKSAEPVASAVPPEAQPPRAEVGRRIRESGQPTVLKRLEAVRSLVSTPVSPVPRRSPDEPSTVRVTIGRVEVKAPPPPAPPAERKPASQAPTLSLDEYLEQRRSGRR
jgi:hypothetical protein